MAQYEFYVKVIMVVVAIAVIAFLLVDYMNNKKQSLNTKEGMQEEEQYPQPYMPQQHQQQQDDDDEKGTNEPFAEPAYPGALENEYDNYAPVNYDHKNAEERLKEGCYPSESLSHEDLLPKDQANSRFSQLTPAGQGQVDDKDNMPAGYLLGVSTTNGTHRNANRQLRSEPPNPQYDVTPFNKTTIPPDTNRRPFEIGGCS